MNEQQEEVVPEVIKDPGNNGLHKRFLFLRVSKKDSVMGSLCIPMFEQERNLPNGVSLKLQFHRQREPFTMMTDAGNANKIDVQEAYMLICKVKPILSVNILPYAYLCLLCGIDFISTM